MRSLVTSIFLYVCRAPNKNTTPKKILHISYKDHVTNEEVRGKTQQAIGPHEYLLTIVKRRKL